MSFGPFRVKTVIFYQNRVHQVNTGQTMSTRVKNEFRVKTVIFDQNRVHQVSTGQTMSTRVKNEFRAVSGQNRYF
jgi:phosphotransferase system IIB component